MSKNEKTVQQVKLPEGVTAEMITAWKERYGEDKVKIATLLLDDEVNTDNTLDVIVRVPGRKELNEFEKHVDREPDKAKAILVNSCLLSHKEEVKANDMLFLNAYGAISQLIPIRKAIIKNL